jgi:hypothetical protein
MIEKGATHLALATDHVVEFFRNELYAAYKTSAGEASTLLSGSLALKKLWTRWVLWFGRWLITTR